MYRITKSSLMFYLIGKITGRRLLCYSSWFCLAHSRESRIGSSFHSIQYSRKSATGLNASRDRICLPRKIFEKLTQVRRVFSCYFWIIGKLVCTLSCSGKSISLFDGKLLVNNLFRVLQNEALKFWLGLRTTFCYLLINEQIWTLIQSPEKSK